VGASVSIQTVGQSLGYLGASLGVAMVLPQIARTLRHRHLAGVSVLSWFLLCIACTSWLMYGIRAHETVQIPGNILLVSGGIVVVLLVPSSLSVAARAALLAVAMSAVVTFAMLTPQHAPGMLGFGIGIFSVLPQLRASFSRSFTGPSAVSIPTWVMRTASQASWLAFAIITGDIVVLISAVWTMSVNAAVLSAELRRARRAADLTPADLVLA
jgi:uncharacterized protein with PQ loop repeat